MKKHNGRSTTRIELRHAISSVAPHIARDQAGIILDEFFDEIIEALARDEDVKLRGFGRFNVHHKPSRPGRNPKTGEEHEIKARRSIKFAPSQHLIARVNGETYSGEDQD